MNRVLLALVVLATGCRQADPGDDVWSMRGDAAVTVEEGAGPGGHFSVYRPTDLATGAPHPVVVFSVGTGGSPDAYRALLEHWASHGFVVVAGDDGNQANGDQALEGLAWILAEDAPGGGYAGMIDEDAVGASGHSQGGNACLHVALRDARVDAVVPLEPGRGELGDAEIADQSRLAVPVFYVCGENDRIVSPDWCRERFVGTPASAWMGVVRGANHFAPVAREPGTDDVEMRGWSTRWLRAWLAGDAEARAGFEGDAWTLATDPAWTDVMRR